MNEWREDSKTLARWHWLWHAVWFKLFKRCCATGRGYRRPSFHTRNSPLREPRSLNGLVDHYHLSSFAARKLRGIIKASWPLGEREIYLYMEKMHMYVYRSQVVRTPCSESAVWKLIKMWRIVKCELKYDRVCLYMYMYAYTSRYRQVHAV
jgi:hypothetical protein